MAVKSKVKINKMAIRQLSQAAKTALEKTGHVLQDEIRQAEVIPMQTGALRGEQFFIDNSELNKGHISLVHSLPYARRLYFHPEYNFSKEFASHAKGKWFEDWISGSKKKLPKEIFMKFYKRESGI